MIEYEFNELDNDFITCWSKYLLTGDSELIMSELEALAQLGQINAVQNWYLFNDTGVNSKIDDIVKGYKDSNYNQLFAKARFFIRDEEQVKEYDKVYDFVDEDEYIGGFRSGHYELTDRAKECRKKIYELPFIECYNEAKKVGVDVGNRTNNYIILESVNEMYNEFGKVIPMKYIKRAIFKNVRKNNKKICTELIKEYSKTIESEEAVSKNPSLCFSLAKAILLFNEKHKYKDSAVKILKELSQRKYSQELREEISKKNVR